MDVIVPVYNNAKFLGECLNSLIGQTVPFARIVVVDDASPDPAVLPILKEYAERSNTITLLTNEVNRGISLTQNAGLACCQSELVAFVDCDDFIGATAVEEVYRAASDAGGPTYIFTDRTNVDDEGLALDVFAAESHYDRKSSIADALLDGMFASHLKVINRSALTAAGGFAAATDGIQDWDMALKLSEMGSFLHVKQPLYSHRIHAGQNSTTDRTLNFRKTNNVRRRALQRRGIRQAPGPVLSRQVRELQQRLYARLVVRVGEDRESFIRNIGGGLVLLLTESGMGLFHLSEVLYNPAFSCPESSSMIVVCVGWADLGRLRFVPGIAGCNLVLAPLDTPDACSLAQWFNSYFETIAPLTPEAELSCLGYLWDGAELLETSARPPTRKRQGAAGKAQDLGRVA